jgi:hypothetical protein
VKTDNYGMTNVNFRFLSYREQPFVLVKDPTSFKEAMKSRHSSEWLDAMKHEMKSMSTNDI